MYEVVCVGDTGFPVLGQIVNVCHMSWHGLTYVHGDVYSRDDISVFERQLGELISVV